MRLGTTDMRSNAQGKFDSNRELLFCTAQRELHARGIERKIAVSARGGEHHDSPLQCAIRDAMEQACRDGATNPIVMGAIPFDMDEACCLYVPTQYEWCERQVPSRHDVERDDHPTLLSQHSTPDENGFKRAVEHAIVNFRHSEIRKAVLSVMRELHFSAPVDVDSLLSSLQAQNPEGYQFRIPLPDGADLIGVSPELLLRKQGNQLFSNPLAGSAKRQPDAELDQAVAERLLHSPKDLYEHRVVIDEVRHVLEPLCNELHIPDSPSLMNTPVLWHLSTRVEGQLRDPELTSLQLACRLHPTPAVCGLPTDRARKLISLVEPFERGLFTGMVGWCDAQGNGEWAVTIRCGMVDGSTVKLFAGAGIVDASQPDAEWAETQVKLGTMLRACGLSPESLLQVADKEAS